MTGSHDELLSIARDLEQLLARGQEPEIRESLDLLRKTAGEVGKASSGSWLGYHANVYYTNLQTPPPGAHFNSEWGLGRTAFVQGTDGEWAEHDPDQVNRVIYEQAGNPDMTPAKEFNRFARTEFTKHKSGLLSIIEVASSYSRSQLLIDQKEATTKLALISKHEYLESWKPRQATSRDSLAGYQGSWFPPHARILAQVISIQTTIASISSLAEIAKQVASHTLRQKQQPQPSSSRGTRVFIGHGHSLMWRELKDFLEDRLGLLVDEFDRVPPAGIPTSGRLSAMLETAAIAFLVMTGEDEQSDGELRARENVVHEAGLFQGRLGFERAIVLLEGGCEKFSNIDGLGHIPFPKGNISAAFEVIRKVLEREGVLKVQVP